jgi:hypothetical protein
MFLMIVVRVSPLHHRQLTQRPGIWIRNDGYHASLSPFLLQRIPGRASKRPTHSNAAGASARVGLAKSGSLFDSSLYAGSVSQVQQLNKNK